MRVKRRALLVAGIAGALTMAGASAAEADSSRCTVDAGCAGRATFASYGEVFTVYDQSADGHSAVALYWLPDGSGPHMIWNSGGNGTSVTANLEFPEGAWVTYRVCLGEGGPKEVLINTCGAALTDYA
ncbi:MAG TPA: hypothetical protein VFV67_21445 [Actinophytocola sp.]|uniref:hypothetical protein n=1 Tax=Actinophytocola sp. TaxID=1872138 RepID=UPI002DB909C8|nr:hypothetical protein [Actinophytocola sp.]HEU5473217.1 hypothetical protein [Actinophytocola sp.]